MISSYVFWAIFLAALVTWIPRILPYFLVKLAKLPDKVVQFLSYLPITIIFALILSSIFTEEVTQLPRLKWVEFLAVLPTFFVVAKTKNVMLAVAVGIICVAFLRFVM